MRGCLVKAAAAVGGRLEEIDEEKTDEKDSEAKSLSRGREFSQKTIYKTFRLSERRLYSHGMATTQRTYASEYFN